MPFAKGSSRQTWTAYTEAQRGSKDPSKIVVPRPQPVKIPQGSGK
jgi:hypothetical protein